jgi:hypothetical protein
MSLISFSRVAAPSASITFTINPSVKKYSGTEDYYQEMLRADGGDIYIHDLSLESYQIIKFYWEATSRDNFIATINFYKTMKKSKYSFTFTDFDSNTSSARFISPISWNYIKSSLLSVSFNIIVDEDRIY